MPKKGAIAKVEKLEEKLTILPPTAEMVEHYRQEKNNHGRQRTSKLELAANQDALKNIFKKQEVRVAEGETIDVYNPSNEFELNSETYIAGRTEPRSSEFDSRVIFFKKVADCWEPLPDPVLTLQDPSITKIGDELVLCGVKLELGLISPETLQSFKTVFYKGKSLEDLKEFASGPDEMKDVRLVELSDHRIGVFTRPQQILDAKRGQIGFVIINSLAELDWRVINDAPLLDTRFPDGEWGGANEASLLPDEKVFVLGHRAYYENYPIRHYYPWAFIHDPLTGKIEDLGILAERADFPDGPAKREDLTDVLFSAGIKRLGNNRMLLRVGMSDCEVGEMERDTIPLIAV